jgi:hypothetical protein
MQMHQCNSLCRSSCNLDELSLAVCAIVTLRAHIINSILVVVIAGNSRGWRALLAERIVTIGSQHANVTICARIVVIAWSTSFWGPRAIEEVTKLGEGADVTRGARIVIVAWVATCGRSVAPDTGEISVVGGLQSTGIVVGAVIIIIAWSASVDRGRSFTGGVLAGIRQDACSFVCALVVVVACAASERCATASWVITKCRLSTNIVLRAILIDVARLACRECPPASEK